jgi:hypothetical protein
MPIALHNDMTFPLFATNAVVQHIAVFFEQFIVVHIGNHARTGQILIRREMV